MIPRTLSELLRERADERPDAVAYGFLPDGESEVVSITYADLELEARRVGQRLSEELARGSRVILLYPPGLEFIIGLFAAWQAGLVPVPVYPPMPAGLDRGLRLIQRVLADADAHGVLTVKAMVPLRDSLDSVRDDNRPVAWFTTDRGENSDLDSWRDSGITDDSVALIQYTSGSTSHPKGVVLRHRHLLENQRAIQEAMGTSQSTVGVTWLPLYHDMGLIGHVIHPLFLGIPSYLISPLHFLQRPLRWLQAISRFRGTVSGGPNFAYELCARKITQDAKASLDLASWRVAYNAAEPVRGETLRRFASAFSSAGFDSRAIYPCYGLAEATLLVTGAMPWGGVRSLFVERGELQLGRVTVTSRDEPGSVELVSSGRAPASHRVVIVDPDSAEPVADGSVGEIWAQVPSAGGEYWRRPGETADNFGAALDGVPGHFLRTGDLGFLHEGQLFVTGRIKDLIIIRGRNVLPQDIEDVAQRVDRTLRPGCGIAFGIEERGEERVALVQEVAESDPRQLDNLIAAIRRAVSQECDVALAILVLVQPRTIQKTTSGKLARHACREAFLTEQLEVVAEWRSKQSVPVTT